MVSFIETLQKSSHFFRRGSRFHGFENCPEQGIPSGERGLREGLCDQQLKEGIMKTPCGLVKGIGCKKVRDGFRVIELRKAGRMGIPSIRDQEPFVEAGTRKGDGENERKEFIRISLFTERRKKRTKTSHEISFLLVGKRNIHFPRPQFLRPFSRGFSSSRGHFGTSGFLKRILCGFEGDMSRSCGLEKEDVLKKREGGPPRWNHESHSFF